MGLPSLMRVTAVLFMSASSSTAFGPCLAFSKPKTTCNDPLDGIPTAGVNGQGRVGDTLGDFELLGLILAGDWRDGLVDIGNHSSILLVLVRSKS
jgi:hypothetical protein